MMSETDSIGIVLRSPRRGGNKPDTPKIESEEVKPAEGAKLGLNTWRLAALTFFTVSGGPYGLEPLVQYGGPVYAIYALLLIPWFWALPMAMMTAELSSALPEMGGYIVWVQRTMGNFWAFQNSVWNIFSNALDNTLYPILFLDYIDQLRDENFLPASRFFIGALVTVIIGCINVIGVDIVGDGATVFGCLVILPFIVMVLYGTFLGGEMDVARWSDPPQTEASISGFLTILLWNSAGYDSAGTCAAEVEDPGKTYTKAMLITVALSTAVYVLPIMVGVCYADIYDLWEDGYFAIVGDLIAGHWMRVWITISGAVSALGLLNSTMCTTSRALASMATYGYIPQRLSRLHPKYGTPYMAILLNCASITILLATGLNFESVAEMSMWLYALTLVFEFIALLLLRVKEPNLARPFRVPLSLRGLTLMCIPPCFACLFLVFASKLQTWLLCLSVLILGALGTIPYNWMRGEQIELNKFCRHPLKCSCCDQGSCRKSRVRYSYSDDFSTPNALSEIQMSATSNSDLVQIDLT